jgi:L-rhamnose mutarotase
MDCERVAFRLFLKPGMAAEYKRRHDAVWPELRDLLKESGICEFAIYLDEEHHVLFATQRRKPGHRVDLLPAHPIMRRWWSYMSDIMRTGPDGAPVSEPLPCMFLMG